MAFRRFTEVSLMIRSDVGVTGRATLPLEAFSTTCFERLLAERDATCSFAIA